MSGKNKRVEFWRKQLAESGKLTTQEYIALLREIRDNSAFSLFVKCVTENDHGAVAFANVLDKVHWLLDSADKAETTNANITIGFELQGVDDRPEAKA